MKNFLKKYGKWIIITCCVLLFILIAKDVLKEALQEFDANIFGIIEPLRSSTVTIIMLVFTQLASPSVLLLLSIFFLLIMKKKKDGICILINLANIGIFNLFLKTIFMRDRPFEWMLIDETGYSFPSGHAMASIAFYGFLLFLVTKNNWSKNRKTSCIIGLVLLIFFIGFSRLYLGVHYTSDVLAGFSISLGYLLLFIIFVNSKWIHKKIPS